jgi:hypothetical protein
MCSLVYERYGSVGSSTAARIWETNVRADYQAIGNAELGAEIEGLEYDLADSTRFDPASADVVRINCCDRLRLARAELRRREALHAAGAEVADPHAPTYQAWHVLAREVRERGDIVTLLQTAGVPLERAGKEWGGPCPMCGGHDRFRVWTAPAGRRPGYWCRRCGISGDVIAAYRNWVVPGASFFDATRVLALQLGLRTPDHSQAPSVIAGSSGVGPLKVREVRRAGA